MAEEEDAAAGGAAQEEEDSSCEDIIHINGAHLGAFGPA